MPGKRYSERQWDEMVAAYVAGDTRAAAAAIHGARGHSLLYQLKKRGIPRRAQNDRIYYATVDETRFAEMGSEEEAYWAGWLFTDGWVTDDGKSTPRIGITLSGVDREHLVKFAAFMKADRAPRDYSGSGYSGRGPSPGGVYSTFSFHSPVVAARLARIGMRPRKTWTVCPWEGPPHLVPRFWLGAVEGDGWILITRSHGYPCPVVGFCGTEAMVRGFSAFILERLGWPGCISLANPKAQLGTNKTYTVTWRGWRRCKPIVRLLYDGATVWLDRKKATADRILAHEYTGRWAVRERNAC